MSRSPSKPVLSNRRTDLTRPFAMSWLNSSYQETLLPGAPWYTISPQLSHQLANYLERQMSIPERAVILSSLLGEAFMAEYFPAVDPLATADLQLSDEERKKLTLEAAGWLRAQLTKAAVQIGCLEGTDTTGISTEMLSFVKHASHVFHKNMNRELYKIERDLIEERKKNPPTSNKLPVEEQAKKSQVSQPQRQDVGSRVSTAVSIKSVKLRAALFNLDENVVITPNMTSKPSDFLAESVVKLLERSPRCYDVVCKRLHGRMLPSPLRRYMWTEGLYKGEREKLNTGVDVERILREKFGRAVARNVGALKIQRATQSPMRRVIENAVVEKYQSVPALAACGSVEMMQEANKALNVLYTYDKTYEPYLILWLLPLQLAYTDSQSHSGPELVYELAMHLDLLNSGLFPTWPQVYAVTNLVMTLLSKHDAELYEHLERVSSEIEELTTNKFVVELVEKEVKEAEALLSQVLTQPVPSDRQRLLTDPRLYLRKWIGEGFVSVLDTPAVMYIWDQLFLQSWSSTVLQDFALVMLTLLRDEFLAAADHVSMRDVFLHSPSKLLLADIRSEWLKLHKEGENSTNNLPNDGPITPNDQQAVPSVSAQ